MSGRAAVARLGRGAAAHRGDGAVGDREDAIARGGADRMHTGEGAERGQHADVVTEPEAWQAQMIKGATAEAHARVQMAGEHVGAAPRPWVVAEREAIARERLIDDLHAEVRRRIAGSVVVVAAHKDEIERGVGAAPAGERADRRRRVRMRGVEEVAKEDDAARTPGRIRRMTIMQAVPARKIIRTGDDPQR